MEKVGSKFQLLSPPVYILGLHHMWNVCKRIMEKKGRRRGYVDPED